MLETFINYVDKFGPEIMVILTGLVVILSTLFLWLWFSNRRKYHNLKHAIPANVVKSYLDSIIQNSTALKSSLFRGGGMDVGAIPSVMPLGQLMGGDNIAVSGAPSAAMMEELNQKKAQLSSLEAQLSSLQNSNRELDTRYSHASTHLSTAEKRVKELEAMLAGAGGAGADDTLKNELTATMKERDEIRDRLREFEIIADDLANLKRLQQENEQLKRSLAAAGAALPAASAPAAQPASPVASSADVSPSIAAEMQADVTELFEDLAQSNPDSDPDTSALDDFLSSPESNSELPENPSEMTAAAPATPEAGTEEKPKNDRTPEDLLSEFEKMLG